MLKIWEETKTICPLKGKGRTGHHRDQPWRDLTTTTKKLQSSLWCGPWSKDPNEKWRRVELVNFTYLSGCRSHEPIWLVSVTPRKRRPRSGEGLIVNLHPMKNLTEPRWEYLHVCVLWEAVIQSHLHTPLSTTFSLTLEFLKWLPRPPNCPRVPRSYPRQKHILVIRKKKIPGLRKAALLTGYVSKKAGTQ